MEPDDCMLSMQNWLVVSYMNVVLFWLVQKLGALCSHAGENFIFSFRQRSLPARVVISLTWGILVPFFAVWTVLGTLWFRKALVDSPDCISVGAHPWLVIFWQVISYVWLFIYVFYSGIACLIEHRRREAEKNQRLVETEESLSRWGRLSSASGNSEEFSATEAMKPQAGLQYAEILALPSVHVEEDDDTIANQAHCPICLCDFVAGDAIRPLPGCGHVFHQSCVDLWLVRRADCPLCKGAVQ